MSEARRHVRHDVDGTAAAGTPTSVDLPLIVDLDGTLVKTDTLVELFLAILFSTPLAAIGTLASLGKGRAAFKRALLEVGSIDPALLPPRGSLLSYLREEKRRGRELHLVSAANQAVVERCGSVFEVFDSVQGSDAHVNLKGLRKLAHLRRRFPDGFVYAGDSRADLAVWQGARGIVLAGASEATAQRARALGVPVEREFETGSPSSLTWLAALRPHQWSKNLLVFVPLLLSERLGSIEALTLCAGGFVAMCLMASATYLINDVADLESDRRHASKRFRPVASGELTLVRVASAALAGVLVSLLLAASLTAEFAALLALYLVCTLSYSFRLKRVPILDVAVLAGLYTLRLVMGMALAGTDPSTWLLTFSAFFFFSMSLAKRHAEIAAADGTEPDAPLCGRGYTVLDAPLVLSAGVSGSTASVLVVIQYLTVEAFPSGMYGMPELLWLTPVALTLWTGRVWLLAARGQLDQDPVAFAVRDRISWALGAATGLAVLIARAAPPS